MRRRVIMRLMVHPVAPLRCPFVLRELVLDGFRRNVLRESALIDDHGKFAVWYKLSAR